VLAAWLGRAGAGRSEESVVFGSRDDFRRAGASIIMDGRKASTRMGGRRDGWKASTSEGHSRV
jgi:hypothetical protein